MSTQSPALPNCACCTSRRRFLAASCGVCAGAATIALGRSLASASEAKTATPVSDRPRVRLVFACWAVKQKAPTWPHVGYNFTPDIERVSSALKNLCPDVELLPAVAHSPEDAQKLLAADGRDGIDGYVVYQLNNWIKVMQPIVAAGRPTLVADFLYGGSGGVLVYGAEMHRRYKNFSIVASSKIEDLARAVRCFELLKRGGTTADFIAACDRVRQEGTPAPSKDACKADLVQVADVGQCLEAMKRAKLVVVGTPPREGHVEKLVAALGIGMVQIGYDEIAAAHEKADREQVLALVNRWKSTARSIVLDDVDGTLEKSARGYLAQKAVMERHRAEAITVHCLGGFYGGKLKAYPCLGFTELLDAGMVGACEADLVSAVTMIAMKHMAGRPGFISDPVLDTAKRQIIYAHCVAATRAFGPGGESNPYEILTHSEDRRGASIRSFLPLDYKVTTLEIHPGRREILCHRARAVENVVEDRACRTKLACEVEGDMEKLFTFWDRYGWHRVTVYGDLWEPVKELAAALKFKFVAEA